MDAVKREALRRAGENGKIFIDEIDKVAGSRGSRGPDVSREGVQRDILPIVAGSTVSTKHGRLKTDHVLFIAAGAFHMSKPSDLIPEPQGRFPIRVERESLTAADFKTILTQPKNALITEQTENIGARRLHTVLEKLLEDIAFDAPETTGALAIDAFYVRATLERPRAIRTSRTSSFDESTTPHDRRSQMLPSRSRRSLRRVGSAPAARWFRPPGAASLRR